MNATSRFLTRQSTAALVLSLPLLSLNACSRPSDAQERATVPAPAQASISVPTATSPSNPEGVELAGDLKPVLSASLSFKTGGRLAAVRVARGARVTTGQVLASLSDEEARAAIAQAEAAVKLTEAQAAIAEDADKRVAALGDANAIASNTVVATKLGADAARAGVLQARAAVRLARANQANHVLTAPFPGVIVSVPDGIGSTVGPGQPLLRIEQLDTLVLHATVGESEIGLVRPDQELVLRMADGKEVVGKVRVVINSLDPVTRRAPVEIDVPNPNGTLLAGSYVRGYLRTTAAGGAGR